jgi:dTMP kinase
LAEEGKFIVVEGIDGSGKTNLCKNIERELLSEGIKTFSTKEPTDLETGKIIKKILSANVLQNRFSQSALFLADRIEHLEHPKYGIKKHLKRGYVVVCDRYYYSSFAYQSLTMSLDWVMTINLSCSRIIKPDLCIFLDTPPVICRERIFEKRKKIEVFERDIETMNEIRENYFRVFDILGKNENVLIVSKKMTEENEILQFVKKEILKIIV